jgi:hypothetical protein
MIEQEAVLLSALLILQRLLSQLADQIPGRGPIATKHRADQSQNHYQKGPDNQDGEIESGEGRKYRHNR